MQIGHKVDCGDKRRRSVLDMIDTSRALGVPYIETSAISPYNVTRAFMLALYWYAILLINSINFIKEKI